MPNSVNPGGETDGLVYFPKETKKYKALVLTVRVGALTFEFPWSISDR
jgi:hypothetical protein